MTSSNIHSIQSKNLHVPAYGDAGKTLATKSASTKRNEAAGAGNELAVWVENNRYVYDSIMAGSSDLPPAEQEQFMQWWSWAMSQIQSSAGWDPSLGNLGGGDVAGDPTQVLPEGAEPGPNGNAVFRKGSAETTYVPTSVPVDVLSDEFTLNVDVKVQDIVVEKTTDTRLQPPVDCIKITVKDPYSTPSETVYFVHELDAEIKINTVGGQDDVTINGDIPNVTVEKYDPEAVPAAPQASVEGEPVTDDQGNTIENSYYYEVGAVGETIDFNPKEGENDETHYVVGSANISVPISSEVEVNQAVEPHKFVGPDGTEYDMVVTVTHKDGSKDTYYLQNKEEFSHNINALSGNMSYYETTHGAPVAGGENGSTVHPVTSEEGQIPEGFNITLNGNTDGNSGTLNPDYPEDTQPAEDVQSKYWDPEDVNHIYDSPEVNIHATGSDTLEIHANEVNITLTSMMDEILEVTPPSDGHPFYQLYIKHRDGSYQTILINPEAKINIDGGKVADEQVVNLTKGEHPITLNGGTEDSGDTEWPSYIDNLAREVGKSPEAIATAIYNNFGYVASQYDEDEDGSLSPAELNKAIEDGAFPPSQPNQDLLEFIAEIDDEFKRHLNNANKWEGETLMNAYNQASARLVDVLKSLYPDMASEISFTPITDKNNWRSANNINFGDRDFQYSGETEGQTTQLNFATY